MLESEIKILCENHEACLPIMIILEGMGFTRLRDVSDSSVSFDIMAKREFHDEKDVQETVKKVFDSAKGKIHRIQITRKNRRSF